MGGGAGGPGGGAGAGVRLRGARVGAVQSSVPSPSCCRATNVVGVTVKLPKPPLLPGVWNLREPAGTLEECAVDLSFECEAPMP